MVTEEEAERIRADYKAGMTYRELAKKYRKSLRDIAKIIKGGAVEKVREEAIMTWELPHHIKMKAQTESGSSLSDVITFLMKQPAKRFSDPNYCDNLRSMLFILINIAAKHGIRPHREDLDKVLRGKLELAAMRWIKKQ